MKPSTIIDQHNNGLLSYDEAISMVSQSYDDIYTDELSYCCEAPITESGFCSECWEHAK